MIFGAGDVCQRNGQARGKILYRKMSGKIEKSMRRIESGES